MINDNRHKNNSSRGFNFPYIQSPTYRSNVTPATVKSDVADVPAAAEDESTLVTAKSEQQDVSSARDPLRIASVLLAAKAHITPPNELSAATITPPSLTETPDESVAVSSPASDNKNPDKLPEPQMLPLTSDSPAVIPDKINPPDMLAAGYAAENADKTHEIIAADAFAADTAADNTDDAETAVPVDAIPSPDIDGAEKSNSSQFNTIPTAGNADDNHSKAAAFAAVPTASGSREESNEPADSIKTASIDPANKKQDDAHQKFFNENSCKIPSLDGLYGRGLFHYKEWWFRHKIEISVNGKLISGIPIFTDHNTLRVVNEQHSYFIPIEKIDYIRTSDGLHF